MLITCPEWVLANKVSVKKLHMPRVVVFFKKTLMNKRISPTRRCRGTEVRFWNQRQSWISRLGHSAHRAGVCQETRSGTSTPAISLGHSVQSEPRWLAVTLVEEWDGVPQQRGELQGAARLLWLYMVFPHATEAHVCYGKWINKVSQFVLFLQPSIH